MAGASKYKCLLQPLHVQYSNYTGLSITNRPCISPVYYSLYSGNCKEEVEEEEEEEEEDTHFAEEGGGQIA